MGGELRGRGRLAAAVDADHQDDRRAGAAGRGPSVRGGEKRDELVLEDTLEPGLVLGLARLRSERPEDPVRGRDADVGEDERLLEAVQDLLAALAAAEEVLDLAEGVPGPGQFFPEASEHGLNILFFKRLIVNARGGEGELLRKKLVTEFGEMGVEGESRAKAGPAHDLEADAIDQTQGPLWLGAFIENVLE